jgi:antibiotic biosynthesis monooxygenase (ABM) superfamily enzyme
MISRIWHGWTSRANANAYENLLRKEVLPGIHRVRGFKGAHLLRRDANDEVEFVTITRFDSLEAVKEFAGEDYGCPFVRTTTSAGDGSCGEACAKPTTARVKSSASPRSPYIAVPRP